MLFVSLLSWLDIENQEALFKNRVQKKTEGWVLMMQLDPRLGAWCTLKTAGIRWNANQQPRTNKAATLRTTTQMTRH